MDNRWLGRLRQRASNCVLDLMSAPPRQARMVASPYNKQIQKAIRAHGPVLASGGGQYQPPSGPIQVRATKRTGTKNHRKAKFETPQQTAGPVNQLHGIPENSTERSPREVAGIAGQEFQELTTNGLGAIRACVLRTLSSLPKKVGCLDSVVLDFVVLLR